MKYVLGIDQGGSKTHAALADSEGNILSVGRSGGGYHAVNGMDYAMARVREAALSAAADARVDLSRVAAVGAGMTGADFAYEYPLLERALAGVFPGAKVAVKNDCMIALYAASESEDAVILCAGTGFNCGVRRKGGAEFVFGYYIDDRWQGGAALGQRALQAVFDSEVGLLPDTALTQSMLRATGKASVDELMQAKVRGELNSGALKHFVREIDELALAGDQVARALLADFGGVCARYALAGMKRLHMPQLGVDAVLSGSVFKCRARILKDTVAGAILAEYPKARLLDARYEPVVGGVMLALQLLNRPARLNDMETTAAGLRLLRNPDSENT